MIRSLVRDSRGGLARPLVFALVLAWVFSAILPASPAFAGQTVIIDSGAAGSVVGNSPKPDHTWDLLSDDPADLLDPESNTVILNSGTVDGSVYGGYAVSDGDLGSATAPGNTVTISGGTVDGNVYGGLALSTGGPATATGNTVNIYGSPALTNSILYGGSTSKLDPGADDAFTGNTLNVWNYTGSAVAGVENFQYYNFVLPTSLKGLEVTGVGGFLLNDGSANPSTVTGVSVVGGGAPVQPGDTVILVEGFVDATGFTQTDATGKHGATLLYDWTLDATSGGGLIATLDSVATNPQAKTLSEGFLGGLALTTQGADVLAGQGMDNAVGAAQNAGGGFGAFGALSGGSMRLNSGSHVDMNSVSLLTGLVYGMDASPGYLTLGAFFEYGNGSYDTHNAFSTAAAVNGDGDTDSLGGGLLGRMDFAPIGPGRFHAEASARIGTVHNDYNGGDLTDSMGRKATFASSSLYYGVHFGTGYLWDITEAASLDLSAKYFWTRQKGDAVTLSTGDPVEFQDADSHRLRLGARFAYAVNEFVSPYIGAAYEHEFDGKAQARTYGYSIDAPSLRGATGIGEIGLTLKPSRTTPLSFDVGVQSYTGKREGVTGSVQAKFEF